MAKKHIDWRLVLVIAYMAFGASLFLGFLYVAVHFIRKFW